MTEVINSHRSSSSLWSDCQPNIQRRINALLNYQAEYFRLRVEFHRQLHDLQYAYNPQFEQIFEQRRKIIDESNTSRLDHFWLTVLKNLDSYDYPIQPRDEICLKYLVDIRCILNPPNADSTSFTLEFHFSPLNPFFTETILTKNYSIRFEIDESNPYRSYDGPEIDQCHGCSITWKPEHNLTIRKRNKRIRNKITGQIEFVQIEKSVKSFFNFFSPPLIPTDGIYQMTDDDQIHLEADIEFGLLLKQRVLPRAILYYTGEAFTIFDQDEDELTSSDSSS
jgi:hypothetical protein